MENQWKEIKKAYKHILNNAFDNSEQINTAHTIVLKLLASLVDLSLSGDRNLKNAVNAFVGKEVFPNPSSEQNEQTRQNDGHSTLDSHNDNNDSLNGTFGISNASASALLALADQIMNSNAEEVNENNITNDEIQSLFPLWNMFLAQNEPRNSRRPDT